MISVLVTICPDLVIGAAEIARDNGHAHASKAQGSMSVSQIDKAARFRAGLIGMLANIEA